MELQLISGPEILRRTIPPKEFIVSGLIPKKSICFLAGEEGCGKSIFAQNLALAVAEGRTQFLGFEIPHPCEVIILNNELSVDDWSRRLQAMSKGIKPDSLARLRLIEQPVGLESLAEYLSRQINSNEPHLVIIDCFYLSHESEEKDNDAMRKVVAKLLTLRNAMDIALLVVHHTRKGSRSKALDSDHMRGAGALAASADSVLMMTRNKGTGAVRLLQPTKLRHGKDTERNQIELILNPDTLQFERHSTSSESSNITVPQSVPDWPAIFNNQGELSRKEIHDQIIPLGMSPKTVDRMIASAKAAGMIHNTAFGKYAIIPPGMV